MNLSIVGYETKTDLFLAIEYYYTVVLDLVLKRLSE